MLLLPLGGCECLLREGVNGFELLRQCRVDQAMPLQQSFALKLLRHDKGGELTTTAVGFVNYLLVSEEETDIEEGNQSKHSDSSDLAN